MPTRRTLDERIAEFSRPLANGCIEWVGTRDQKGYGKMTVADKILRAHRVVYELRVGEIPAGMQLDHLCRTPSCVNPAHLEPVTSRENTLRGVGASARHARKTHCKRGHEFTPENTSLQRGTRQCKRCKAIRDAKYRAKPASGAPDGKEKP